MADCSRGGYQPIEMHERQHRTSDH